MVFSVVGTALATAPTTAPIAKDEGIEIIGLETGDSVSIYQVLQWNTNTGWGKTTAFSTLADASVTTLIGTPGTYNASTGEVTGGVDGTLTAAIATEIKGIYDTAATSESPIAATSTAQTASQLTDGFGVKFTNIPAGLYMAIITSGSSIVSYNPVFVACDYKPNNGETQALVANTTISNVGYAKKTSDFDVDKKVKDGDTGVLDEWATAEKDEIVQFVVNTTIPSYHSNEWLIDKISYAVKDSLNGLALVNDETHLPTVKVKAVGSTGEFATLDSSKYELTAVDGTTSLTLNITPAYLKEITGPYSLELTYYAKVTDAAVTSVSATDNKVTVEYSNNPSDQTSKGTKHDVTNHYKFALDAVLFGDENYHTSELVKVGLGKDGQPIYERTGYSNYTKHSALQDAKFGLYSSYADAAAAVGSDGTLTSGEDGRFLISNLDVGTYYLVETKAPDGYIRDNSVYKIVISATEKSITVDDGDCKYTTDVLDTYTVAITEMTAANTEGATTSSTYTMNYYGADETPTGTIHTHKTITLKSSSKVTEQNKDTTHKEDNTTEIKNKQGTPLPSTGGIGTTIFYVAGIVLVLGAAAIIIARRKAEQN
jgi:LPXTG-motif cell wall-anchored protein